MKFFNCILSSMMSFRTSDPDSSRTSKYPELFPKPINTNPIFARGIKYTPEQFEKAINTLVNSSMFNFDPFCQSLLDIISVSSKKSMNSVWDFKKYMIDATDFSDFKLLSWSKDSWTSLLDYSFASFSNLNPEKAADIFNHVIAPGYPIFSKHTLELINNQLLTFKDPRTFKYSEYLDETVVMEFYSILNVVLLNLTDQGVGELFWKARKSIRSTDKSFRYHYAFLMNVPYSLLKSAFLTKPFEYKNFEIYLADLARCIYEQYLGKSGEVEIKQSLALVLPNVYENIDNLSKLSYDEIIKIYVKSQNYEIKKIDSPASVIKSQTMKQCFLRRIRHFIELNNGYHFLNQNQVKFADILFWRGYDDEKSASIIEFATRNIAFCPTVPKNDLGIYWRSLIYSLIVRYSALYPENMISLGFTDALPFYRNNAVKTYYFHEVLDGDINSIPLQFLAKHGFYEALKAVLDSYNFSRQDTEQNKNESNTHISISSTDSMGKSIMFDKGDQDERLSASSSIMSENSSEESSTFHSVGQDFSSKYFKSVEISNVSNNFAGIILAKSAHTEFTKRNINIFSKRELSKRNEPIFSIKSVEHKMDENVDTENFGVGEFKVAAVDQAQVIDSIWNTETLRFEDEIYGAAYPSILDGFEMNDHLDELTKLRSEASKRNKTLIEYTFESVAEVSVDSSENSPGLAIISAVNLSRYVMAKMIIKKHPDCFNDKFIGGAIRSAILAGDAWIIQMLLDNCGVLCKNDVIGILVATICKGNYSIFTKVFDKFEIKKLYWKIIPELIPHAVSYPNLEIFKFLVDSLGDNIGCLPETIKKAAIYGRLKAMSYLLEYLQTAPIQLKLDYNELIYLAAINDNFHIIEYLSERFDYDTQTVTKIITSASESGNLDVIIYLIDSKNYTDYESIGYALQRATVFGHVSIINYFLRTFPLIDNAHIRKSFIFAVHKCQPAVISCFLSRAVIKEIIDLPTAELAYSVASMKRNEKVQNLLRSNLRFKKEFLEKMNENSQDPQFTYSLRVIK